MWVWVCYAWGMSLETKRLGDWGESVAATHLESLGFEIVARNWRCAFGEIDLVARRGESVSIVEVKTRRGRGAGSPEEAITKRKADRLLMLCGIFLAEMEWEDEVDVSIDLVAIELDGIGNVLRIEHVPEIVAGW